MKKIKNITRHSTHQVSREPMEYKNLIRSLLYKGGLNDEHIDLFTNDAAMKQWSAARVHASAISPDHPTSYNYFEAIGDGVYNQFVMFYIFERYPDISVAKWVTLFKHYLAANRFLGHATLKVGLDKFILLSDKVIIDAQRYSPEPMKNKVMMKILGDVFEAFLGCLVILFRKAGLSDGIGVDVSHAILKSIYDEMGINVTAEDVYNPITRLKEMYDVLGWNPRWAYEESPAVVINDKTVFYVTVFGWPLNDRTSAPRNKVVLSRVEDESLKDAKEEAARQAVIKLRDKYKIVGRPIDIHERERKKEYRTAEEWQ